MRTDGGNENADRSCIGRASGFYRVADQPLSGVRCLVVEDDELQAKMQTRLLAQAGVDVTTTGTLREGRAALERAAWDLLIVDLGLPDGCGSAIASQALARTPAPGVVILSGRLDLLEAHELTSPRALIVSKGAIGRYLVGVARAALEIAGRCAEQEYAPNDGSSIHDFASSHGLSDREREVLGLLVDGISPKQIANSLGIADATVRYYARTTFRKCGVKNQREVLALYARTATGTRRSSGF